MLCYGNESQFTASRSPTGKNQLEKTIFHLKFLAYLTLLDRFHQQVMKLLFSGIFRQKQNIEAGMSCGKSREEKCNFISLNLCRNLSLSDPFLAMVSFSLAKPPTGIRSLPVVNCKSLLLSSRSML